MEKQLQEKFTTIAQNQNAIKELGISEGIGLGIKEAATNSKYIEKQASGSAISLNDVSEVYHKVKVYGDNQEVEVLDNILRQPYYQNKLTSGGVTWTVNDDGSVLAVGTSTATSNFQMATNLPLESGKTYTFSTGSTNVLVLVTYKVDGSTKYLSATSAEANLAWVDGYELVSFGIRVLAGVTVDEVVCPSIYESDTKQTITATPTGTEIDSMCPNMTFITYSDAEANLLVEYYSSFGMQTEYDRFWDVFQENGTRSHYNYAFSSYGWTDETFKPKYDIKPRQAIGMFTAAKIKDIAAALDRAGVKIDTSAANSSYDSVFRSPHIERIPYFVMPPFKATTYMFNGDTSLHTIDGLHCNEANTFTNSFTNCSQLTRCIFSGVIASDINLQWSKLLDAESLVSLAVTLAHLIETGENPDGTNIPDGLQFNRTVTLSPESWAILDNTLYPGTGISCSMFITTVKGWNRA